MLGTLLSDPNGGTVLSADPSSFVSVAFTPLTVAITATAALTVLDTTTESSGLCETNVIVIACVLLQEKERQGKNLTTSQT